MKPLPISALVLLVAASQSAHGAKPGANARATLEPKSGSAVTGEVNFQNVGEQVLVTARISGLKPNTEHGFHVHEKGDCSAADATSAGGHFNPGGHPHGHYAQIESHAGDMPNLKANANGVAKLSIRLKSLRVGDGPNSVLNRAVVVHAKPDDYKSQPAGDAGARIACGVIKPA